MTEEIVFFLISELFSHLLYECKGTTFLLREFRLSPFTSVLFRLIPFFSNSFVPDFYYNAKEQLFSARHDFIIR